MPKESYVLRDRTQCYLLIIGRDFGKNSSWTPGSYVVGSDSGFWILGNNFLHNYYSIYDLENQRVGLVPSRGSSVTVTKRPSIFDGDNFEAISSISLLIILILGILVWMC